jgi:hypothetical protein
MTGASFITLALVAHAAALLALGAGIRLVMRTPRLGRWMARRLRQLARGAASFQETARESPVLAPRPTAALLAGRTIQVAQYAVLAHAAGVDVTAARALLSQGLNLISLAAGALVPGQIGVSEGAFVLSATALGTTEAKAMAIALLAHVVQVSIIPIGALAPLLWRVKKPDTVTDTRMDTVTDTVTVTDTDTDTDTVTVADTEMDAGTETETGPNAETLA